MSVTVALRPLEVSDFSEWLSLWEAYNVFYGRSGTTALPAEISQKTWERFFDSDEPMHAWVAECDAHLVGLVHFIFHRSTLLLEPTCYLQDLFTVTSLRGQGIGRALINTVYEQAKLAGSTRVYWQTHETNGTAMKLYDQLAERSGFLVYRKLL